MKLHNLSVIFVIIAIPLILITSYYISLQIDTINMQTAYNTKLLDSTKEAIDAFEINTVEWNANYSETADSKRRDIMASINTFTSSFANNIGVGGASKEYIMAYMPAIAYTLYDGYYIYSPANTKVAITDENGVGVVMTKKLCDTKGDNNKNIIENYTYNEKDEGKLLYKVADGKTADGTYNGTTRFTLNQENADTEDKHILKPFAMYSEKIGDWVINYTLDNYITIYGNVENEETGNKEFVSKSGYLTDLTKIEGIKNNSVIGIIFNGIEVKPEELSEKIAYKEDESSSVKEGVFSYVYESDGNTKVYFDEGNNAFIVGSDLVKIELSNNINRYKKVTIPQRKSGQWTYKEVYQSLYDGKWYDKEKKNVIAESNSSPSYDIKGDKKFDYSAINYCVESYIVTKFVNGLDLNTNDSDGNCVCGYSHGNNNPLSIGVNNNPESKESYFSIHKRGIIKNVIESNLNQAITSYSRNNQGEYKLPKLTETDWDQILRNVSIITFIQNIPIGMKYYNNYAIATSTMNKEYVDPEEIYLNATGDENYHMPYCKELTETGNMIGYRSIDYVQKSYTKKNESGENETKYYYKHSSNTGNINVSQACYYCLVQKSLYEENKTDNKEKAYYTALARERYVARMAKLPAEVETSYYINVTPYTEENVTRIDANTAQYYINDTLYTGKGKVKINKTISSYDINPTFQGQSTLDNTSVSDNLGDFGAANETSENSGEKYSVYKSNSNAKITINQYDTTAGINFSVVSSEGWTTEPETAKQTGSFTSEADGYINIELKYEKNYTVGSESSGISAFANIDSKNKLTIVTNTGDITGCVRLRFTNTNNEGETKIYYSNYIFNVENKNSDIYCKIENDNNWHNEDWKVEILNVAGENIKSTTANVYTIRDATGLIGFSNAVNVGAKTEGRTFKLLADIEGVGNLSPIAGEKDIGGNGWNNIWFKGNFQGEGKTIKGITMNYDDDSKYNAFGLFGWVGSEAKIENLNVEIEVSLEKWNFEEGYEKNIICIGGIAGYTDAQISNCTILGSSKIGNGEIEVKSEPLPANIEDKNKYKEKYCVGGIAGYAGNTITQSTIENGVNVTGGKINDNNKSDEYLQTYTGGVIGYKNTLQQINSSFNVNCTVSGHDNVGGIIGYNVNGEINNVSFNGTIKGDGENIGGIVGYTYTGTISNCTNTVKIDVEGENVGGIVGGSYGSNIQYCYNKGEVKGNRNVGGIAGTSYLGTINNCGNEKSVIGENNINKVIIDSGTGPIDNGYGIGSKTCTGTGGIAGKIFRSNILNSYNSGDITCNFNGGGITGLAYAGEITYCYNTSKIQNTNSTETETDAKKMRNRLGGICGAAIAIKLDACYNTGEIMGKNISGDVDSGLWACVGGILGLAIDNSNILSKEELNLKYIDIDIVKIEKIKNEINYCYNVGNVKGDFRLAIETTHCNGGIAGYIGASGGVFNNTNFTECYYLNGSATSGRGTNNISKEDKATVKEEKDLKELLYTWANGTLQNNIYNTIAPLETDKGYGGYGVLSWQLNDYVKLTTNMFLCNRSTENGVTTTDYTNFKNTGYNQTVVINNQANIAFRETKFNTCRIAESFNGNPVENDTGCYRWVMMIPKGRYTFKGTTDFSNKSVFIYNSEKKETEDFGIEISEDTTLYVAPILEVKPDNFDTKKIDVEWKRETTYIKRLGVYTKPDFIPRTITVNSYYYKSPCKSSYNINGKTASVYLDKIDTIGLNNTTAYLDNYTYYTVGFFEMHGPYTKSGDQEKIRVDSAECNIYVPVQNLVDKLGDEKAKNYILHTAKVNMKYRIRMWCEKGDFGSWWTNPAKLKNSKLEYTITVQRKGQGSSEWTEVKSINIPTFYKKQTSESGNIGDDGYYTFEYEINKEDFSGSIADVKYNDELRLVIGLKFESKEGNCTFYVDNADLDITYGPNLRD